LVITATSALLNIVGYFNGLSSPSVTDRRTSRKSSPRSYEEGGCEQRNHSYGQGAPTDKALQMDFFYISIPHCNECEFPGFLDDRSAR
jgi:hypothetical protein